jgi:hypothetical protein
VFSQAETQDLADVGVDINNVGSIVQALFAADGDGWDEGAVQAAQAYQVSILSVSSFVGRLSVGV